MRWASLRLTGRKVKTTIEDINSSVPQSFITFIASWPKTTISMSAVQAHQIWVLFFKGNANPYTELPRAGRHLTSMQVLKACGEKLCEYGRCEVTRSLEY